jgi:hypothetical protein
MPDIEYKVVAVEKPDMLLTHDEVKRVGYETNSAVIYKFIMMYEMGHCTWEQAMQGAALHFSRLVEMQRAEILRLISHMPPQPIVVHNEAVEKANYRAK